LTETRPIRDRRQVDRPPTTQRWRLPVAILLWLVVFAWSNIPPYRGNVLEEGRSFFVWHWQLYTRGGEGICDVRYFDMNQGGEPIERWTLLGYENPGDMPDKLARTEKKKLIQEYKRVCSALRKSGIADPHVEVQARCAEHSEWKTVESRKRNVCTPGIGKSKAKAKAKPQPPKSGGSK
jgi:hypothetical protein